MEIIKIFNSIWQWFRSFLIVVILAFIIRTFIIQTYIIEGSSMEPNFHNNQYLLVDKITPRFTDYKRGDVIIFTPPKENNVNYIKRIIGLPGEKVEIKQGKIYINNKLLAENYEPIDKLNDAGTGANNSIILSDTQYYVLGDNRDYSRDSRVIGPIPQEKFSGRVFMVVWPYSDVDLIRSVNY